MLEKINDLVVVESQFVKFSFAQSVELGRMATENAIDNFENFLRIRSDAPFVPQLDIRYRTFIIALSKKLSETLKEEDYVYALKSIIFPGPIPKK